MAAMIATERRLGNGQIDPRTPFGTPGMPGAGPHLGSGLLGNPEHRYHSSQLGIIRGIPDNGP